MITKQQKEQLKILMESGCYEDDEAEDELSYLFNLLTKEQRIALIEKIGLSVVEWVDEGDLSLFNNDCETVLIELVDAHNGISGNEYSSFDISWIRSSDKVCATSGDYKKEDVRRWCKLPERKDKQ